MRPVLSIVIPTANAERALALTLESLAEAETLPIELVIADGGSTDGTLEFARRHGARVVTAQKGRGVQLAAGAQAATGAWLLFLHADTVLSAGWAREAARFMADSQNERRAAVFRFALDDGAPAARRVEKMVRWRCRRLGLPYGDQGLLICRRFYDSLGGFRPMPLMEDVDLVRRIGRRRLARLDATATTSAVRYRGSGYLWRGALNLACLGLYIAGVEPRLIARFYG
ncbi:MAG: TIGR04283 family arsenosugar biosynthesis glycosyltransferase [Alphaproteobacteria bacterium]